MKIDNLTDVFCYVSAILVVVDMDSCSVDTGLKRTWQWELGAFTLTVTWLNLLSLLRSEASFNVMKTILYVIYFSGMCHVSYNTFMKVSVVVLLFIFAFSLRRRPNL